MTLSFTLQTPKSNGPTLTFHLLACGVAVEANGAISVPYVTGQEFETTTAYGGKVFQGYMKRLDQNYIPLRH